jgi:serine/threonine protein kinase
MPYWWAPEIARGEEPRKESDVYAFGILVLEMLNGGSNPFESYSLAQFIGAVAYYPHTIIKPPSKTSDFLH